MFTHSCKAYGNNKLSVKIIMIIITVASVYKYGCWFFCFFFGLQFAVKNVFGKSLLVIGLGQASSCRNVHFSLPTSFF